MNGPTARLRMSTERDETTLSHVEFAQIVVGNRRAALDLTVDQVRELAAALLVIDHQLSEANRRMANMMIAEAEPPAPPAADSPEIVHVPLVTGGDTKLSAALEALVKARRRLEQERHSAGENLARQTFEKAAFAITDICTPKQRK